MSASSTPEGPGSASGPPNLPTGFTDVLTSRFVGAGEIQMHAVVGGNGPPLRLVHGWPETWYVDFNRLRRVGKTEAVPIAAGIFLDTFNIFPLLLELFGNEQN